MLFQAFDRIRVVNLRQRLDRRQEMCEQLALVGLRNDPKVAFFEALSFKDAGPFRRVGSRGAFMSHLAILSEAAEAGESVLILQDDCDFILPRVKEFKLPSCDIFYGGYSASDPERPENSDIVGAHFMGFSAHAAKAATSYLKAYLSPDFVPDELAAAEPSFQADVRPPIDGALVWFRRAHPELKTVFAMLSEQRSSRTDIGEQRWFDQIPGLRHLAQFARKRLRQFPPRMS